MADRLIYDIEFKGVDAGKKSLEEITKLQIAQQEGVKKTQAEIKAYEKSMSELQKEIEKNGQATESQIKLEALYNENLFESIIAAEASMHC